MEDEEEMEEMTVIVNVRTKYLADEHGFRHTFTITDNGSGDVIKRVVTSNYEYNGDYARALDDAHDLLEEDECEGDEEE